MSTALQSATVLDYSFLADVDFSSSGIYRFVVAASTQGRVGLATTAGGSVLGIAQTNPKAGDPIVVRMLGTSRLQIDSASAASIGKYLKTGSDGQGLGYQSLSACVYGPAISLENVTSGSGIEVEVFLVPPGVRD